MAQFFNIGRSPYSRIAPDSGTIFYGSLIPTASNRKYAKTNTAPFRTIPVITNHSFLDTMAKIIPSTESTVNTLMPNVKFALGPLIIKKKITLIITVNIDKNPNILFVLLFKIEPSIPLVIFQQSGPFVALIFYKIVSSFPIPHCNN